MDYTGNYGIGPNTFYIPFTTVAEGKRLEKFLNSNDYKTMALGTKNTRQYLKIAFIEHLKLTNIMKTNKTISKKINSKKINSKKIISKKIISKKNITRKIKR
jgi:hypothetical protein